MEYYWNKRLKVGMLAFFICKYLFIIILKKWAKKDSYLIN